MPNKGFVVLVMILTARTHGFLLSPKKVCYGKYGCFERQPGLNAWLVKLPESPADVGTSFHMFTRDGFGIVNDVDESKLTAPKFDISRRTIFVIHGYTESKNTWATRIKDALLEREDCNVILVDWRKGAKTLYGQAAGNTRLVGAQVAELIRFLISSSPGSPDLAERFYIVGFSLGAQTAGYAGSYLKARRMTLGRITGLDPAGPLFTNVGPKYRLDPDDAKYVDVIHTDALAIGTVETVGHADFWPNGGFTQPGCILNNLLQLFETVACDHMRAPEYYIASVQNRCSWKAFPCDNYNDFEAGKCLQCNGECPTMGYGADQPKKFGAFYLKTTRKAPFCGLN
ncbi:inactive pancreatic lipase-related protein 1-like isoform X1 [Oculina patagonica]